MKLDQKESDFDEFSKTFQIASVLIRIINKYKSENGVNIQGHYHFSQQRKRDKLD